MSFPHVEMRLGLVAVLVGYAMPAHGEGFPIQALAADLPEVARPTARWTSVADGFFAVGVDASTLLVRVESGEAALQLSSSAAVSSEVLHLATADWEYVFINDNSEAPFAELWRSRCGADAFERVLRHDGPYLEVGAVPSGVYYTTGRYVGGEAEMDVCFLPDDGAVRCRGTTSGPGSLLTVGPGGALVSSSSGDFIVWSPGAETHYPVGDRPRAAVAVGDEFVVWVQDADPRILRLGAGGEVAEVWRGAGVLGLSRVGAEAVWWTSSTAWSTSPGQPAAREVISSAHGLRAEAYEGAPRQPLTFLDCDANHRCAPIELSVVAGRLEAQPLTGSIQPHYYRWRRVQSRIWYEASDRILRSVDLASGAETQLEGPNQAWTPTRSGVARVDAQGRLLFHDGQTEAHIAFPSPGRGSAPFPLAARGSRLLVHTAVGSNRSLALVLIDPDGALETLSEGTVNWRTAFDPDGRLWFVDERQGGASWLKHVDAGGEVHMHGAVEGPVRGLIAGPTGAWMRAADRLYFAGPADSELSTTPLTFDPNAPPQWAVLDAQLVVLEAGRLVRLDRATPQTIEEGLGEARLSVGEPEVYVSTCGPQTRILRVEGGGLVAVPASPVACSSTLYSVAHHLVAFDDAVRVLQPDGTWETVLDVSERTDPWSCLEAADGESFLFVATTPHLGQELWRSDGTPAGTHVVRDLNPGPGGSRFSGLAHVGGAEDTVLVSVETNSGFALYAVDARGMFAVSAAPSQHRAVWNSPRAVLVDGTAYFSGFEGVRGHELFGFPWSRIACEGCCDDTDCSADGLDGTCVAGSCVSLAMECAPVPDGRELEVAEDGCSCRANPPRRGGEGLVGFLFVGALIGWRRLRCT